MEIRPLAESDLIEVAHVHILAFPDSALTQLGMEALRRYYLWQLSGPHDSLCIGAFDGTKMTGFCFAGVFRGAETGFLRRNMLFLTWYLITHPGLLTHEIVRNRVGYSVQAMRQLFRRKKKPTQKRSETQSENRLPPISRFGILSIAVNPEYQGSGVGKLLMRDVEAVARRQGFSSMRLTVHPDNNQAVIFYEKHGWRRIPAVDGVWRGFMAKFLGD
jgi:ribosomal protein S18 acetylase RimI-like enzyme